MSRDFLFDFTTATANEIVAAIENKQTSLLNLYGFRHRVGANVDKLYPETRSAMNIIKSQRKNTRNIRKLQKILKPYSNAVADGRDVREVIQPVITAWRLHYAECGLGLMDDQILMLLMIQAGGQFEELTGQTIPDLLAA